MVEHTAGMDALWGKGQEDILAVQRDMAYGHAKGPILRGVALGVLSSCPQGGRWTLALEYAREHQMILPSDLQLISLQRQAAQSGTSWIHPATGLEMIWIAPGRFLQGGRRYPMVLSGFSLARHPVTNENFRMFLERSVYHPAQSHPQEEDYLHHWFNGDGLLEPQHPVRYVSWVDAQHYCAWAGFVLPTVFMWEKAARGTDGRRFPWGSAQPHSNLLQMRTSRLAPVGSFPNTRTAYGCQDMLGNIMHWCQDHENPRGYASMRSRSLKKLIPSCPEKVPLRGTAFHAGVPPNILYRTTSVKSPTRRAPDIGFRPAFGLGVSLALPSRAFRPRP